MPKVGVLALQGNYSMHIQALKECGAEATCLRKPTDLLGLQGVIIPGGESSAMLKLMTPLRWQEALIDFSKAGGAVMGTCAGIILMASQVDSSPGALALMDIRVKRNAYGRQLQSQTFTGEIDQGTEFAKLNPETTLEMVCIRAPKVTNISPSVTVLAQHEGIPMLISQHQHLACSFHPEMGIDRRVHHYFLQGLT